MKKFVVIDCVTTLGITCPHYMLKQNKQKLQNVIQAEDLKRQGNVIKLKNDLDNIIRNFECS